MSQITGVEDCEFLISREVLKCDEGDYTKSADEIIQTLMKNHPTLTPKIIKQAITFGVKNDTLIRLRLRLRCHDGVKVAEWYPVGAVTSLFDQSDDYYPIDEVMDDLLNEYPRDNFLIVLRRMTEQGLMQVNDKLHLRLRPQLVIYDPDGNEDEDEDEDEDHDDPMESDVDSSMMATEKNTPRDPSPYTSFIKDEMTRIKKAKPSIDHKEAFKMAVVNWKTAPENPRAK